MFENRELVAVDLLIRMADAIQVHHQRYPNMRASRLKELLAQYDAAAPQPYGWEAYRDLLRGVEDAHAGRVYGIEALGTDQDAQEPPQSHLEADYASDRCLKCGSI